MEKGWEKIFETSNELRIEIARQILEDNDIEAIILNKKDSFYQFGDIEIYVNRDNILKAKQALKELET
jgi:hypothetical protein